MKRVLLSLGLCAVFVVAGCGDRRQDEGLGEPLPPPVSAQEPAESAAPAEGDHPDTEPAQELRHGDFPLAFGFADLSGDRLLVGFDEEGAHGEQPERYTLAIGPYGETVPVAYSHRQDGAEESSFRHLADNFDRLPGHVYLAGEGGLQPDQTYCLTAVDVPERALIPLLPPRDVPDGAGEAAPGPDLGSEETGRIAALRSRGIVWGAELASTADRARLGLVLFERLADEMLFSIVYLGSDKTLFWDCPAEYDEYSTWRAGMGDEPGMFTPLLLARQDSGLMLLLTWGAPEGERIVLLYEDDGRFIERSDYSYDRYWMAE